jgi:hypothetical protein
MFEVRRCGESTLTITGKSDSNYILQSSDMCIIQVEIDRWKRPALTLCFEAPLDNAALGAICKLLAGNNTVQDVMFDLTFSEQVTDDGFLELLARLKCNQQIKYLEFDLGDVGKSGDVDSYADFQDLLSHNISLLGLKVACSYIGGLAVNLQSVLNCNHTLKELYLSDENYVSHPPLQTVSVSWLNTAHQNVNSSVTIDIVNCAWIPETMVSFWEAMPHCRKLTDVNVTYYLFHQQYLDWDRVAAAIGKAIAGDNQLRNVNLTLYLELTGEESDMLLNSSD